MKTVYTKTVSTYGEDILRSLKKAFDTGGDSAVNSLLDELDIRPFSGEYSLSDIAYVFGITRERVRQIEATAIKKLRHPSIGIKLRGHFISLDDDGTKRNYGEYNVRA